MITGRWITQDFSVCPKQIEGPQPYAKKPPKTAAEREGYGEDNNPVRNNKQCREAGGRRQEAGKDKAKKKTLKQGDKEKAPLLRFRIKRSRGAFVLRSVTS
jgi:hypothetical protein